MSTTTIRVQRLPRALARGRPSTDVDESSQRPREVLSQLAEPFGGTGQVLILASARAALLEMKSSNAADAMLESHARCPLLLCGRPAALVRSNESINLPQGSNGGCKRWTEAEVLAQCSRCLSSLISALERREVEELSRLRKERHAAHLATLNREFSGSRFLRHICWAHYQRQCEGGCERWHHSGVAGCALDHSLDRVNFCCAPPRWRTFVEVESYPAEYREVSLEKSAVNQQIVWHARQVFSCPWAADQGPPPSSLRAVVLDGPGGSTASALLACGPLGLTPELVDCPNICTTTYEALRAMGSCKPFLGSLRAFLDSRRCPTHGPTTSSIGKYAVVYADYCCSLYAGRHNVELSPLHDLITLFRSDLLADSFLLAVTLARPERHKPRFPSEVAVAVAAAVGSTASLDIHDAISRAEGDDSNCDDDDAAMLCAAVARLADGCGRQVLLCESFDFSKTYVRMWRGTIARTDISCD